MSLTRLLMVPVKLFKKDVISFLIIRRHDLGLLDDNLRYLAVKPTASISVLRQKVWHILDLPDFCEEVIILKSNDAEIPLTELRKGNDPRHPYILEVWPPSTMQSTTKAQNMITLGIEGRDSEIMNSDICELKGHQENLEKHFCKSRTVSAATLAMNKSFRDNYPIRPYLPSDYKSSFMPSEYKKPDLSCKISSSSLFFKLQGRKSRDNFAAILLKIQSDLSTLSNKLSNLENKIP